jgi:hypothetical protein
LERIYFYEYISGDGTFRVAPQPFEQMYTFSFFVRRIENRLVIKKIFGGIYVLMSHRNTFLYEKILVWLLEYAVQHNIQVLRKKVYRENEERVEILMYERTNGNLDTMQFLDAMYHRIGE